MNPKVGQIYVLNDPASNPGFWRKVKITGFLDQVTCYTKCIVDHVGDPRAGDRGYRDIDVLFEMYSLSKETIVQNDLKELLK